MPLENRSLIFLFLAGTVLWGGPAWGAAGEKLVEVYCAGCHVQADGSLSRIKDQRKTPEGWEMTINRMRTTHGLSLQHETMSQGAVLGAIVKYLADTRGLAPSETTSLRYVLEQDGNVVEQFPQEFAEMCGRCHSSARVALQRRTREEWDRTVDFHLGQWPSTEYSLYGRDRPWLKIARENIVPALAVDYPLETDAWAEWQAADKSSPAGEWVISGHVPGEGDFSAVMSVSPLSDRPDRFSVEMNGHYADGSVMFGEGSAIIYTGFEWRATVNVGETTFNQTFALTSDGQALQGRMYQKDQVLVGARVKAIKQNERVALLSVYPRSLPIGETTRLTVSGFGLGLAEITIADANVEVIDAQDSSRVIVDVTPIDGASVGYRSVSLAGEEQTQAIAFYESVDELAVEPSYGIARIGGNGGGTPKVETVFRARGKSWGADQQPGTSDDLDLGYIDAVTWRTVPRDEGAEQDNDVAFAGNMDPSTGRYVPAAAGPNPQRARSTNNAGNLNVVARYEAGEDIVEGTGRLLVTVQRWVNPPMN